MGIWAGKKTKNRHKNPHKTKTNQTKHNKKPQDETKESHYSIAFQIWPPTVPLRKDRLVLGWRGCLCRAKFKGDMTNSGECGLAIQQEQAGTVTSAGDEPSSKKSVSENSQSGWRETNRKHKNSSVCTARWRTNALKSKGQGTKGKLCFHQQQKAT